MKKQIIAAAILSVCAIANSGTVYRDRVVPGSVCIVPFGKNQINAALIQQMSVGEHIERKWISLFKGYEDSTYTSFRVTLVNGTYFETRIGNLEIIQHQFLETIKTECK